MFTGIVEEIGRVESIKKGPKSLAITIRGNKIFSDLKIGDSVAVNGVCLTATTLVMAYLQLMLCLSQSR